MNDNSFKSTEELIDNIRRGGEVEFEYRDKKIGRASCRERV